MRLQRLHLIPVQFLFALNSLVFQTHLFLQSLNRQQILVFVGVIGLCLNRTSGLAKRLISYVDDLVVIRSAILHPLDLLLHLVKLVLDVRVVDEIRLRHLEREGRRILRELLMRKLLNRHH
jgi:hypothetical protein